MLAHATLYAVPTEKEPSMAAALEDKDRELIRGKNFAHVVTTKEDGRPRSVLVWIDEEDGNLVLNSAEGRAWPTDLRRDPRVTITVANHENPYEYVTVEGRLAGESHDDADEVIDRLAYKYLGAETYPMRKPGEQRVTFRITPEKVRHHG